MVATNDLKALLVPTRLRRGVDENEVQPFRTPEKRPESNRKALQKDQDPTYRRASVRTGEFCKRLGLQEIQKLAPWPLPSDDREQ
jgi:hypothetical protein